MYSYFIKRIIDFTLSFLGLMILIIPMIIISIFIKLDSKGSVIFKQRRLGINQKEFTIYKFRTMVENAYEMGGIVTSASDYRITKVGALLRRTSLDELPQMVNILLGQMSIIGPRPILKSEFEPYSDNTYYKKRYTVLPGLFCTVDINYRASADRDLQFAMDAEYVDNISFKLDCSVFFKIIGTILSGKNVYKNEDSK